MVDALVAEQQDYNNFNDYSSLLAKASEQWELDPSQIEDYMDRIAFHESKGDVDAIQMLNDGTHGDGRGLFQFEIGKGRGGQTAGQRLINTLGYKPDWVNFTDDGFDASVLNKEQQKMLFLANYLKKPGESSGMKGLTQEGLTDWWLRNHWAGTEGKEDRRESFNRDMEDYGL
jgi:hypothetical protein